MIDEQIDAWVERVLAKSKPLTSEQRVKLAELLRPVRVPNGKRHSATPPTRNATEGIS
jgi:hypothetical protein